MAITHRPTEGDRHKVETMAGLGMRERDIAHVIGIRCPKTLRRYYRHELDRGFVLAHIAVTEALYRAAMGNGPQSVTACIFWLKCRLPDAFGQPPALFATQEIDDER